MLRRRKHFCILVVALLLSSCAPFMSSPNSDLIDLQKARAFSDMFIDDVISDRRDTVYSKMEKEFQDVTNRDQFKVLMDNLYDRFGKPTHYDYVRDEVGAKLLYNGQVKPTRKIVYTVRTTKGTYPLSVTVVPNGRDLAVTDFLFTVVSQ